MYVEHKAEEPYALASTQEGVIIDSLNFCCESFVRSEEGLVVNKAGNGLIFVNDDDYSEMYGEKYGSMGVSEFLLSEKLGQRDSGKISYVSYQGEQILFRKAANHRNSECNGLAMLLDDYRLYCLYEDNGELELEKFPINKLLPCARYRFVAFSEIGIFYVDHDTGFLDAVVLENKQLVHYEDLFGSWLKVKEENDIIEAAKRELTDVRIKGLWYTNSCLYLWLSHSVISTGSRQQALLAAHVTTKKLTNNQVKFEVINIDGKFDRQFEYIKIDGHMLYGITEGKGQIVRINGGDKN